MKHLESYTLFRNILKLQDDTLYPLRLLGLYVGVKRVGVAISDAECGPASACWYELVATSQLPYYQYSIWYYHKVKVRYSYTCDWNRNKLQLLVYFYFKSMFVSGLFWDTIIQVHKCLIYRDYCPFLLLCHSIFLFLLYMRIDCNMRYIIMPFVICCSVMERSESDIMAFKFQQLVSLPIYIFSSCSELL